MQSKNDHDNNIKCPFCGTSFYRSDFSYVSSRLYLKRLKNRLEIYPLSKSVSVNKKLRQAHPELIQLEMAACPNCHRITVRAVGIGNQYADQRFNIYPQFDAAPLPKYVPDQIREDYKEAVEVVKISPNSAAMLSRRILEEVINNFYHIQNGDLFHDLDQLREKGTSSSRVWQAIDAIRRLGNLSVHSSQNVNDVFGNVSVKGAKQIIELIRMLIHDTYVERKLNHRLEKSVIQSAQKLNYVPHHYQGDHQSNHHRHYRSRRGSRRSKSSSRRRHRRRSTAKSRRTRRRHNHRHSKYKHYQRARRQRNQRNWFRKARRRRSRHRGSAASAGDKSYTIIQNK